MMTWITDVFASPGLNDQLIICRLALSMMHDDVIKWRHFPRYRFFVRGIHRWSPRTKASDADFLYFLWSAPEQMA